MSATVHNTATENRRHSTIQNTIETFVKKNSKVISSAASASEDFV